VTQSAILNSQHNETRSRDGGDSVRDEGNPIVNFYSGLGRDDSGRSLKEIQGWSDKDLETTHDYIQWLFPLTEPSAFNPDAPILDARAIQEFHARRELRDNLRRSFLRMLSFYGLESVEGEAPRIVPSQSFTKQAANWLTPSNHNHLRITRILRSLQLLGLSEEAAAMFRSLAALYGRESAAPMPRISEETFRFWRSAMDSA
jgi:hypothetical protein